MINLYEYFTEFRLVDEEGVILDNPNDYIVIREPVGFDEDQTITLEREKDAHGFLYEFSDENRKFGFHKVKVSGEIYSGYELLKSISALKGVDGMVKFQYLSRKSESDPFVTQYEGQLDFENISIIDYLVTMPSRRVTLGDRFRTRKDTLTQLSTSTLSLDRETITPSSSESMFLHSKVRQFETECEYQGIFTFPNTTDTKEARTTSPESRLYCNIGFSDNSSVSNKPSSTLFTKNGIREFTSGSTTITEVDESTFYEFDSGGVLYFPYLKANAEFRHLNSGGGDVTIGLYAKIGESGEDILIGSELLLSGVSGYVESIIIDETELFFDIPVPNKGLKSKFYLRFIIEESSPNSERKIVRTPDPFDPRAVEFHAIFDAIQKNSYSDVYNLKSALTHNIASITNNDNALVSSFLDNEAVDFFTTNGYSIRSFQNRFPDVSFDLLFKKFMQPTFGLGYAVYDDSGTYKVLVEKYEHFYQDIEIDSFTSIEDETFEIVVDRDLIFNEIKVGYKDYPKSTDENKGNNIDEFNTEHDLLTPVKTVKSKANYINDVIGSGHKIENQRLEQFKDNPSATVSDDDNIFVIKGIYSDTYSLTSQPNVGYIVKSEAPNIIYISYSYLDIQVGDIINLSHLGFTSYLEGNHEVETVNVVGKSLVLSTVDPLIASTSNAGTWVVTLPESRLRAERNENMQILNNVISPETVYNAGLNPKNMLFNQAPLINSGFNPKPSTDKVVTTKASLNGDMEFQFKTGQGLYVRGAGGLVSMDGDLELSDINGNAKLFTGRLIRFVTKISDFDRVLNIRDACLNQHATDNYGYISVTDYNGDTYKGFIMSMVYNPMNEEVSFELREKYVPTGNALNLPLNSPLS